MSWTYHVGALRVARMSSGIKITSGCGAYRHSTPACFAPLRFPHIDDGDGGTMPDNQWNSCASR